MKLDSGRCGAAVLGGNTSFRVRAASPCFPVFPTIKRRADEIQLRFCASRFRRPQLCAPPGSRLFLRDTCSYPEKVGNTKCALSWNLRGGARTLGHGAHVNRFPSTQEHISVFICKRSPGETDRRCGRTSRMGIRVNSRRSTMRSDCNSRAEADPVRFAVRPIGLARNLHADALAHCHRHTPLRARCATTFVPFFDRLRS